MLMMAALAAALAAQSRPADDMEYWLGQAAPAATRPAEVNAQPAPAPQTRPAREDALPGVIELSDGSLTAGWLHTTRQKSLEVYQEGLKQWQQVPLLAVLSVQAVVKEEKMELRWRWKGMGEVEKEYTGAKYPFRRLAWRVRLIDGTTVEGVIRGQPLSIAPADGGPPRTFVLAEQLKGADGQTLADLPYLRRAFVSRRLMEAVAADLTAAKQGGSAPASRPVPTGR
ncbi:MAG: hypothetical protein NT031_18570 [Planctomycetota bacterium]|nr:hypothetical protein [Planctomycetota bacterium]